MSTLAECDLTNFDDIEFRLGRSGLKLSIDTQYYDDNPYTLVLEIFLEDSTSKSYVSVSRADLVKLCKTINEALENE